MNYTEADALLTGRNREKRKLANNTYLERRGAAIAVRLHQTDIVTFSPNGVVTLTSGGWGTATTKERINQFASTRISQRSSIWYMGDGSLFYDGLQLKDGVVLKPRQTEKHESVVKDIKQRAKAYAQAYVTAIESGSVDVPSAGDCWACLFEMQGATPQRPAPLGTYHLEDHMAENYFVPSLLVNAMRSAGYRDDQMGLVGLGGRRVFINPQPSIYKYIVKTLMGAL